mgnify:CR=1 FL=1
MENKDCIKCGDLGNNITFVVDDGEFSNTLGVILCSDCYDSILECITEMLYD